jgi:ammonium transporter Rh
VNLESLIVGDFGAGAAMITFGVILGKCNLQQLMFLTFWEMIFYGLNEAICVNMNVTDAGGSILVHTFGAYFGLGASYFFQPKRASSSKNLVSSYQSEMIAVIGSIFLWMYWPSFNGALASGVAQQRIIVNTVLAISSSCMGGAITARILFGKLEMEIMLNATLAGGVAIGSSCDLITEPWAAMCIGLAGGILSSVGF